DLGYDALLDVAPIRGGQDRRAEHAQRAGIESGLDAVVVDLDREASHLEDEVMAHRRQEPVLVDVDAAPCCSLVIAGHALLYTTPRAVICRADGASLRETGTRHRRLERHRPRGREATGRARYRGMARRAPS